MKRSQEIYFRIKRTLECTFCNSTAYPENYSKKIYESNKQNELRQDVEVLSIKTYNKNKIKLIDTNNSVVIAKVGSRVGVGKELGENGLWRHY